MARCGCSAGGCNCTFFDDLDGDCIDVTVAGAGSSDSPYVVSAVPVLDPDPENVLECRSAGLFVPGGSEPVEPSDWRIGSFVWLQKQVDLPHDVETVVGWDASNILFSETEPSLTPFWTFPGGAGWPVTYQPGVYDVAVSLAINDIPATATGKAIKYHAGGFEQYFIVSPDQASTGLLTTYATWTVVVLATGGFNALFPTGGEVRIRQMLVDQLDDVYVNLIVSKIGHVD